MRKSSKSHDRRMAGTASIFSRVSRCSRRFVQTDEWRVGRMITRRESRGTREWGRERGRENLDERFERWRRIQRDRDHKHYPSNQYQYVQTFHDYSTLSILLMTTLTAPPMIFTPTLMINTDALNVNRIVPTIALGTKPNEPSSPLKSSIALLP